MISETRELKAIHYSIWKNRCIVFRYKQNRWTIFESIHPYDIGEALEITMKKIEHASPGTLKKASNLDDNKWQSNRQRKRRYIAESPELLYIDSPHLTAQSVEVAGYYAVTNIPWRDVPRIFRLLTEAAEIDLTTLTRISF